MPPVWDPERYLTFADERGRPFVELVSRIGAAAPGTVVDLGCGPGNLTRLLADRWPDAAVTGLDSSPEMIAAARTAGRSDTDTDTDSDQSGISFDVADLRDWHPAAPVDVLVSNATLQWVPGHLELLPTLIANLAPGGWFAFQVPGNFDEPSHMLRAELAAEAPYVAHTAGVAHPDSHDPAVYYDALARDGVTIDVWETTYTHVLSGPDPVFTWVSGTGARPTLQALPDDLRPAFETEFKRRLSAAYPTRPDGTVLMPFRRIFAVAHVAGGVRGLRGLGGLRVRLHHVQVACPVGGEDVARRFYADGLGMTEVEKPADLVARGGAWFRTYDADGGVGAIGAEIHVGVETPFTPARKAHPAVVLDDVRELDATGARLTELGFEVDASQRGTFPGYQRLHAYDGHGNRVELLAPA